MFLSPDHPRVCGENVKTGTAVPVSHGSSPRMRVVNGLESAPAVLRCFDGAPGEPPVPRPIRWDHSLLPSLIRVGRSMMRVRMSTA